MRKVPDTWVRVSVWHLKTMYPVLFSIGPINIYAYGVMLAAAFLVATHLASQRAHFFGISKQIVNSLALTLLIAGIIGARILYILLNPGPFIEYPVGVLMINRGGLVFYGGLLLALLVGIIFAKLNKVSAFDAGDLTAPFIALAHTFGRIGCFLNGCCYGKATSSFFGVIFPGSKITVYPTQLFSSAGLFLIFLILLHMQKRRRFSGQIFSLYLIFYGVFRFFIEFLRGDLAPVFHNVTATQLLSVACTLIGLSLYFLAYEKSFRKQNQ